jgi:hypothetical protein
MDFLEEYDEMSTIPSKIAVTYKFFQLFTVALEDTPTTKRGMHFSTIATDSNLSDEILQAFGAYLKAKKRQLKRYDEAGVNCGKILWFFYQKLLEVGAFNASVRAEIREYMDLCEYIIL